VCIPDRAVSTKAARDLIPKQLSRDDTVFNLSRTALFVAAFQTGDWPLLRDAMDDRLHQPARGQILPILFPVIEAACGAGAHGAALSGSGAAILALVTERHEAIAQAMHTAAAERGFPNRCLHLALSPTGAQVIG
jgi:homoserine kinase